MTTLHLVIDRFAATPLHRQISEGLRQAILSGRLRPGQRIPSSRTLATELQVSRLPVLSWRVRRFGPAPFGLPLNADEWLYFFTLAVALAAFWIARNLLRGRIGRAIVAIREQPVAAEAMGIDNAMFKSLTFGVSAMFTGVAGALGAIAVQFVAPDSFTLLLSITFLVGSVIGGMASISGAVYGALFIQFIPNVADQISKAAPWAIYGVFMIAFVYLMPTGVAGGIELLRAKRTALRRRRADPNLHRRST